MTARAAKTKKAAPSRPKKGGISDPSIKTELWPIKKVKPYEKNPRAISEQARQKVATSIREFGFQQPIVVDVAGVIIAGHTRWQAAQLLGLSHVPVIVAHLSDEKARAYRLADNRTHQESDWLNDLLKDELEALKELDFDLGLTGFDGSEIDQIFSGWECGFDPVDKHGENLDGIDTAIKVMVDQDAEEKARKTITKALTNAGIEHELKG